MQKLECQHGWLVESEKNAKDHNHNEMDIADQNGMWQVTTTNTHGTDSYQSLYMYNQQPCNYKNFKLQLTQNISPPQKSRPKAG